MSKHVSFWLGVFSAALVIMPVALGIWAVAQGFAEDIAVGLFIAIAVLVALLVVVLFLRGPILRRLIGRSEARIEDVSASLIAGVSAAATGDRARAEAEADTLARMALGWYAWSNFYRWVIATALGLLLAFASFTGTVLLFEQLEKLERQTAVMDQQRALMEAQTAFMESQTERLEEQTEQAAMQNEIMTLNLVNELREQILNTVEDALFVELLIAEGADGVDQPLFVAPDNACRMGLSSSYRVKTPASAATRLAIADLAREGMLAERVVEALNFLVLDSDGAVALTSVMILDELGLPAPQEEIEISGVMIQDLTLNSANNLMITDSFLSQFSCPNCELKVHESLFLFSSAHGSGFDNIVTVDASETGRWTGIVLTDPDTEVLDGAVPLKVSGIFSDFGATAFMKFSTVNTLCRNMASLAQDNALVSIWD